MGKKILPDRLVNVLAFLVLNRRAAGNRSGMSTVGILANISVRGQTAGVAEWGGNFVNVDQCAELGESKQLPRPTVMVCLPPAIENVRKTKVAVRRGRRRQTLP